MFLLKTFLIAVVLAVGHSRNIQDAYRPYSFGEDELSGQSFETVYPVNSLTSSPYDFVEERTDSEGEISQHPFETAYPVTNLRIKRQLHGMVNTNPDGSANIAGRLPLVGNNQNMLSATGSLSAVKPGGSFGASSAGLALDNVNGHGVSLTGSHIPNFGNQLTAAGKVNLLNTERHNLNANAFVTRNMPTIPNAPNFNTHGGSLDYMFNNKVGASVGVAQTPLFQKTDLSAMTNLNLFRDRSSSLDFNAGATRSFSPFIPKSSWQPNFGLSYSRRF